ncbi:MULTISPECIES: P-loop NTPase fold protein [Pseudomonas syringae group]|nr:MULTISPECIES: P-loop NTPase fold protein [Pseudomonas syringae group]MBL3635564.1 hypothetical protein [Pseudomonas syringae pv. actinidiae]MDU8584083.1 hypothetical protein [Pseudomonas syringae pv. actinidiae]
MEHVETIKLTLKNFATEETNGSIVLKGAWGTGKTFLWNQIVRYHGKDFKNRNYSYVSLFGISTLKDLKRALFENKVLRENASSKPSADTLHESFKDLGGKSTGWIRKGSSLLSDFSAFGFRGVGPAIEVLQFFRVTDTLIVLDDFERKSASLPDKEVLGLISLLCESKNCRVLMLLNDQTLSDEYITYHEKVFDYEISFKPTSNDAVNLAFGDHTDQFAILKKNCISLDINNLRLLKKIKRYAYTILASIKHNEEQTIDRALLVIPMTILAVYGGKNSKIDLNYIQCEHLKPMPDSNDPDPLVQNELASRLEKAEFLAEYGIRVIDEFDTAIINLVLNGYIDQVKLEKLVKRFEEKIDHAKHNYKLGQAWNRYHMSFLPNEQDIIDGFSSAIQSGLSYFSITELDSVAVLYYELNRATEINPIIDQYLLNVIPKTDFEDEDDIFNWPSNPYFSKKLKNHFSGVEKLKPLTLSELLEQALNHKHGMQSKGVLEAVSSIAEQQYLSYFEHLDSYDLTKIIRLLLKCGQMSTSDESIQDMYEITFLKTYRSLLDLASRSQLNNSRMSKFKSYEKLYHSLEYKHKMRTS